MKHSINIHFTDKCNYACKYCFVKKQGQELSLDLIKTIIDKISPEDYRINLAGGEPLCSSKIQEIIDYANQKGFEVSIITNGSLLTKEFIQANRDKLCMIGISVDSLKEEANLKIGRSSFGKVLSQNILIDLCREIKANDIKLKINICVSAYNVNEDFSEFIELVNPDRIKFLQVMTNHNKALSSFSVSSKEWESFVNKYKDVPNAVFEDNDYMKDSYLIVDSCGNLSMDNLHLKSNSLLEKSFEECMKEVRNHQ